DYTLIDKTTYSYNAKGLLREMIEKDGGKTQYLYRKDGKIRFSQNEEQRKSTNTHPECFSYTNYDKSGRPIESGEYVVLNAAHSFSTITKELLESISDGGGLIVDTEQLQGQGTKRDQLFSFYDEPDALVNTNSIPALPADRIQHFVQGAVSWTMKDNIIKSWYSYDENGRLEWLVQYIKDAGFKTIDYRYGPTGQVQEVAYQKGVVKDDKALTEQFSHFYEYDLDGRLHKVYTTHDLLTYSDKGKLVNKDVTYDDYGYILDKGPLELQATYQYYLHGPLKRVELVNNLQGIDYLYTADGALKSINGADPAKDPGADGAENSTFRSDVFGMTLDYYTNDYVAANGTVDNVAMSSDYADQHTGLVKAMRWHSPINSSTQYAYAYSYDERNQFAKAEWGTVTANGLLIDPFSPYHEGVPTINGKAGYDANGNINFLQRNSNRLQSIAGFNYDLTYNYAANSNKLQSVTNGEQTFRTYQYNDLGQMTTETKDDKSSYITYDITGKVTGVYADLDHTLPIVTYLYDDKGFRLSKTNYTDSGSPGLITWYVRDVSGNVVGTYEDQLAGKGPVPTEIPIYGSERIGLYKAETGFSFYELTDHLGNVRAVIGEQVKNETLATMEDQRSDDETDQFINPTGSTAPSYINHTPAIINVDNQTINITTPPPGKVCRINNGIAGTNPIGVGQMLAVEAGDVIEAEVFVKYENYESDSYDPIDGAAGFLTTSFSTTGTDVATLFSPAVTPLSYIVPVVSKVDVNEPLAFLNYLLYDKYGQLVDHNNIQVSDLAEIRSDRSLLFPHEKLSFNLNIEKGGFLYVYVSNLTDENMAVYFDDLRIKQTMSDIVAGGDYYPYGLAIGDRQIDRQPFRYGYQGKFAEKDDETGWNHFEAREYDPIIGRWITKDPAGQFYSPYVGMGNNPVSGTDPNGKYTFWGALWRCAWANITTYSDFKGMTYSDLYKEWGVTNAWTGEATYGNLSEEIFNKVGQQRSDVVATGKDGIEPVNIEFQAALLVFTWGMGNVATAEGVTILGSDAVTLANASRMVAEPGIHQVLVHGATKLEGEVLISGFEVNGTFMAPKELAKVMLDQGFVRGTPVRLISCETGTSLDGAAYQLSRYLKSPVMAPTTVVRITEGGGYQMLKDGAWRTFDNTAVLRH
ncbi:MAG TPA: RHS repeat-associated core domain-containing protein, partial [Cyclobacteriaceae bacterium]